MPEDGMEVTRAPAAPAVRRPEPDESWHPVAQAWFESLAESGQHRYYEPSDWATAVYVAEAMSRSLRDDGPMRGALYSAVMSSMTELLTTEGARRRARLELVRPSLAADAAVETPEESASVTVMDRYRRAADAGRS